MKQTLDVLRQKAAYLGVFLPFADETEVLGEPTTLHGHTLQNRCVCHVAPCFDADESGAPTEATLQRYRDAAASGSFGQIWSEPLALDPSGRVNAHQLMCTEENADAFRALRDAVREAAPDAVFVALLDHAGRHALAPVSTENCPLLPESCTILEDTALTPLIAACGFAARTASAAGCEGIALNACDRNLFADSLAAYHRDGTFGGDFDDRTRLVRDCFTAMKLTAGNAFLSIRLTLSDGLPMPHGFGMAFEDEAAPDLSESVLLLQILRALYGVELVACEVGIPGMQWMAAETEEDPLITASRLCTCIAMLDSALQQSVQLIVPNSIDAQLPFEHLAAGMISGEFASFAGFRT